MRARRGGPTLALVPRPVLRRPVRMLCGRAELEEAQLTDLHAWPELHRQRRHVGQLERDVAREAGIDEARRRVREQPEPAERRLPLEPGRDSGAERDPLERRAQDEFARVQHEWLVDGGLDEASEVRLLHRRVDRGVAVVLEYPEELVQPHVHAGRLHHPGIPRVQEDPSGVHLAKDVAIAEQHGLSLTPHGSAGSPTVRDRRCHEDGVSAQPGSDLRAAATLGEPGRPAGHPARRRAARGGG